MFRTRPPWFALACNGLCVLQLLMTAVAFEWLVRLEGAARLGWQLGVVAVSLSLGTLLLVQLPRALQWRPRIARRPTREVRAERQRIARDLHDQLGSQLVVAMALLDAAAPRGREVLALLDQCLLDVRLIGDSMEGAGQPLADRLARLRHRMQPALEQRGIQVLWSVEVPLDAPPLHGQGASQLVAIAQEAISNVLQHAVASRLVLRVAYAVQARAWSLEVRDNGRPVVSPLHAERVGAGYGTAGMQRRATAVGGLLRVVRRHGQGTCVLLVVPAAALERDAE